MKTRFGRAILDRIKTAILKRLSEEERGELRAHVVSMLALLAKGKPVDLQQLRLHLLDVLVLLDAEA
jgi:hypothetical protein